jgi:hypothetical protein
MTNRDIEMNKVQQEFVEQIEKALGFRIQPGFMAGSNQIGAPIKLIARFPELNRSLKGTAYLLENTRKVIHFTSAEVLESIIEEGALRLYNLQKSNDPIEYQYAADPLYDVYRLQDLTPDDYQRWVANVKERSFIFSATNIKNLYNAKHWKEYGKNNKGVAIEFEIVNDPVDWRLFYFSKVMYNQLEDFKTLVKNWYDIQKSNPKNRYSFELNQMLCFHKSERWKGEDEIRIYTQIPQGTILWNKNIFSDPRFGDRNKIVKYFKLPLCDKDENYITPLGNENPYQYFPKLRIKNIYFGSDFDSGEIDFLNYRDELIKKIRDKNNLDLSNIPKEKISL